MSMTGTKSKAISFGGRLFFVPESQATLALGVQGLLNFLLTLGLETTKRAPHTRFRLPAFGGGVPSNDRPVQMGLFLRAPLWF